MQISIPSTKVDVLAEADVLVCGGGCSGVAAAVSAARHGASVIVLERWPTIGGLATNGLVTGWHRSDRQKVVINGLVEESAQRAARHGWIVQDPKYPRAHETHWFDPEGMRIVWQRMLDEAGVRTICHLTAGDPILEEGRIRGVLCDTKGGRRAVLGRIVIDATGDGDLAVKAGLASDFGRQEDGRVQGMTLMFTLQDVDWNRVKAAGEPAVDAVMTGMRDLRERGEMPPFNDGNTRASLWVGHGERHFPGRFFWNMCPASGNPLDEEELSRLTAQARERIVAYLDYWRRAMPGYEKARIDQTAFVLGVRESRRVRGRKTLTEQMVLSAAKQSDAVGHGVWMVDIHDPKGTGYTTFSDPSGKLRLKEGTSYHIPLGMALNDAIPNLAVACRAASTTHESLASFRVQTHLMVLAQGVGTCAALGLAAGLAMNDIEPSALQRVLKADGVYLEPASASLKTEVL